MRVSCENYNQCQLTQPDLTPHTARCNSALSLSQTHTYVAFMHTCSLFQSVSPSPRLCLSQSHTHAFSPSFSSLSCSCTHTQTQMDAGYHYRDWPSTQTWGKTGQRDCHSTFKCVECVLLLPAPEWQDLCLSMWQWIWFPMKCLCVCASACVCLCISFYLGIASEQFTACHSLSELGTKRKRERKMDWREKKKARKRKKRERLTIGRKRRAVRSSGGGGKWGEQEKERKGGWYRE